MGHVTATRFNSNLNVASPDDKLALDKPTFCGTVTKARYAARERRERKPQPWAVRKLMVVVVFGIMGYTGYVYADSSLCALCMAVGGPRVGADDILPVVGLLAGWSVLYMWMVWAYIKVILTPPGNACDYVSKTPQPLFPRAQWDAAQDPYGYDSAESYDSRAAALTDIETGRIGGPSYEELAIAAPPPAHVPGTALPVPGAANGTSMPNGNGHAPAPPAHAGSPLAEVAGGGGTTGTGTGAETGRGASPRPFPPDGAAAAAAPVVLALLDREALSGAPLSDLRDVYPQIRPPLSLDGQCVGARNHKFFLNFSLATLVFTLHLLLAPRLQRQVVGWASSFSSRGVGETDIDPQEVVVMALAALFALFTFSLAVAHTRFILLSQTTVESLGVQRLKEREGAGLADAGIGCWEVGTKHRALKSYNAEWGTPDTEGNVQWPGSARAGWEDTGQIMPSEYSFPLPTYLLPLVPAE
ncbi:hypothetical protein B0H13DRAFT_2276556 [Mycena leptocephala]|nr:hypothetical protein B0H13DRAFT_2276556 [Mycena leptocephala]